MLRCELIHWDVSSQKDITSGYGTSTGMYPTERNCSKFYFSQVSQKSLTHNV